jgi:hypothetical protein
MFVVTIGSDPVREPAVLMFRVMLIGAAGLAGAFFWGLWFEKPPEVPKQPQEPDKKSETKDPTVEARIRRRKRVRLATRRNQDGTRDTVFETDEEHFE